jgi:hypothetical protein
LLHKVTDPEGQVAAQFSFGKDGKTTSAKIRWQKHNFQYQGNKTTVKDANGDETIFEHNTNGITTKVTNAEGFTSRIVLSDRNQTQAQLQYASVSGSPWQAVVWSPALSKFLVPSPEQIAAPDDGFQSSKQRRRLYDAKSTIKGHQRNFDKPSNSFSKPAEYSVANCSTDGSGTVFNCYLFGVILDAASTITVGSPYTFSALAIADDECLAKAYTFSIDNVIREYNLSCLFPYTCDQPGQHSVQVTAECSCGGYFKWDGMSVNAQCPVSASGPAYPVKFREHQRIVKANGELEILYYWDSSNGNQIDLKGCKVSEEVVYPGNVNPFTFPPPWSQSWTVTNPTIDEVAHPGENGSLPDTNKVGFIVRPYTEADVTAIQRFRYSFPCFNGGDWQYFPFHHTSPLGINIRRQIIENEDGSYRYRIEKWGTDGNGPGTIGHINPLPRTIL